MVTRTVTPDIDENGDAFISMDNFKDLFDIDQIEYYEVKSEDNKIIIKFFDKDKKIVIPREKLVG